jgi:hypothetical protein
VERPVFAPTRRPPTPRNQQINAEKSPYLTEKLKVWMLPTLALIKNEKVGWHEAGLGALLERRRRVRCRPIS